MSTRPNCKTDVFFLKRHLSLQKGYNHICSASPTKKGDFKRPRRTCQKKIQGAGPFWTEYLRMIFKGWPHRKKSHHQANHPQIGHDGTNSRILCQRARKLQHICFLLKMHLSLQKGTTTYVHLHQPKKVTSRGQGAGVKNKIQGLDLF